MNERGGQLVAIYEAAHYRSVAAPHARMPTHKLVLGLQPVRVFGKGPRVVKDVDLSGNTCCAHQSAQHVVSSGHEARLYGSKAHRVVEGDPALGDLSPGVAT